jgi:DNA topoisomerase-2
LNKITRSIFPVVDDNILKYLDDDGQIVEPLFYAPIIPMILVNGTKGIGTGFSSSIMCYNPIDIISYLQNKLNNNYTDVEFLPYYEGFKGVITKLSPEKVLIKGVYEKVGADMVRVTELPVGFWSDDFKQLLEDLIEPGVDKEGKKKLAIVKDYDDMCKDTTVDFTITFMKGKLDELENAKGDHGCNGLEKVLKLYTTNSTTNMHLFNAEDKLKKYNSIQSIIDDYYDVRLNLYQVRKTHIIDVLEKELVLLDNKVRFIQENLDDTIDLRKKKKEVIIQILKDKDYAVINSDEDYKYLIKMPMDSVTEENVNKLNNEKQTKELELITVKNITINQMWLNELNELKEVYLEYKADREKRMSGSTEVKKMKKKVIKKKVIMNTIITDEVTDFAC